MGGGWGEREQGGEKEGEGGSRRGRKSREGEEEVGGKNQKLLTGSAASRQVCGGHVSTYGRTKGMHTHQPQHFHESGGESRNEQDTAGVRNSRMVGIGKEDYSKGRRSFRGLKDCKTDGPWVGLGSEGGCASFFQ